jgi:exosortase/archaeosortase family protein
MIAAIPFALVPAGISPAWFSVGQVLAYVSLFFGVLFFIIAARYYFGIAAVLLMPGVSINGKNEKKETPEQLPPEKYPIVSIHLAMYNEERVVDRLLTACTKIEYPNYEVVVVDDSTDGTVGILNEWASKQTESQEPKIKLIHRENRAGFKGGALNEALLHTDPKAEYVVVFDADFVPPPDILTKFLTYFGRLGQNGNNNGKRVNEKLAAVQGYQWHTLNRSENWLTRGVSCEFSGNYIVDRTFEQVTGVLKMVAGSVYMIRADLLREYGWSKSITEDWELTLRLYRDGYKILYTPLIQAPAECPSTLGKLVRQRMRWAEGHTYNVKKYFVPLLASPKVSLREKFEFLYYSSYYLQSLFLIIGTFFWLSSDIVLGTRLPFVTATFGWALVFTNLLALPLMSLTGLFFEKRARKDFPGLLSQLVLVYALSPYQAFAALKGLFEPVEGSWVRTFKSGKVAGFPGKMEARKVIDRMLPPRRGIATNPSRVAMIVVFAFSALIVAALIVGQSGAWNGVGGQPNYYFYDQPAPSNYTPFPLTAQGSSFLMHLQPPPGPDASTRIGNTEWSGPVFFSDPAPSTLSLPFGTSVSVNVWVNGSQHDDQSTAPMDGCNNSLASNADGCCNNGNQISPTDDCCNASQSDGCCNNGNQVSTTDGCCSSTQGSPSDGCCKNDNQVSANGHCCNNTQVSSSGGGCCDNNNQMTTSDKCCNDNNASSSNGCCESNQNSDSGKNCGELMFSIDIYNPSDNRVSAISGVGNLSLPLKQGLNLYEASWGHIAQGQTILKGETLVVTIWCSDCQSDSGQSNSNGCSGFSDGCCNSIQGSPSDGCCNNDNQVSANGDCCNNTQVSTSDCNQPPALFFNSPTYPSSIDFPIEVPENSLSMVGVAMLVPGMAALVIDYRRGRNQSADTPQKSGLFGVQRTLIIAAAVLFLTLPLVMTFNDFLSSIFTATGLNRVVSSIVPVEATVVADLLRGFGLPAGNTATTVWIGGSFLPVVAFVDWNCAGWQGFILFGLTSIAGLSEIPTKREKIVVILIGTLGVFAVNVARIALIVLLGYYVSYPAALIFHNYGGTILTLAWLLAFWTFILKRYQTHNSDSD